MPHNATHSRGKTKRRSASPGRTQRGLRGHGTSSKRRRKSTHHRASKKFPSKHGNFHRRVGTERPTTRPRPTRSRVRMISAYKNVQAFEAVRADIMKEIVGAMNAVAISRVKNHLPVIVEK